ncbi:mannose-specific phosphotransferase system enzyme IID component [Weissella oryzae SG25]|uniref:Mannose-specific phosphotransferase system enzyme IID component n=1 Tax=Weissella oryzae (strain DSM 25784 / JCM 18191 / LMG 30913 / SG25) TaxID=1329250 RepID=A0A069CWM6_WEIOS|nr:PTS system mannose/fructose/sorbose family transporter subunit IID [Weissella oryzae]GAK31849.1 mannose-specific phosphotransferase system enzyme IID component [Weissella oryzae SG25]
MDTNTTKKVTLSKGTRFKVMMSSMFIQGSWNYERMQNVGWAFSLMPALKRLYKPGTEEAKLALQRHMEFFNTHPYLASPILGVTLALEEERANGAKIDNAAIQGVKVGMMGPLAGIGDPVFWFTVRPIIGAIAASLAVSGSIIAPIVFFVAWNIIRIAFLWYTQEFGYKQGTAITGDLGGGMLQKVTKGASILGMFVLGALIQRWVSISWTGPNSVVSKLPLSKGAYLDWNSLPSGAQGIKTAITTLFKQDASGNLTQSGVYMTPNKITYLQDNLNMLLPGLSALLLTFLVIWLLRKFKSRNTPLYIIIGLFIFGILLHWAGLM